MTDLRDVADTLASIDPSRYHVVAMPDFFLDHFLRVPSFERTLPEWARVHASGGGNVPVPGQHFQPGGNATNAALALARLGVRTHLITRTSEFGKLYLERTLAAHGVDLRHVRGDGTLAVTTAIEFQESDRPSNLMLSDAGSVAQFGPEELGSNDRTLIGAADLVLVANWSQNARGTALVEAVARAARERGKRVLIDTGDPGVRGGALDIAEIRDRLLANPDVDVYALNENELRYLTGRALATGREERAAARELHARRQGGTLDLHTSRFAATFGPEGEAAVATFAVEPLRVTGAGDAWNAGDALGHLAGLPPEERLFLANAVAGLYVSGKEQLAPTLADVIAFLRASPPLREPPG